MIAISGLRNQSAHFEQGDMEDFRQEVSRANKIELMVSHMRLNHVENSIDRGFKKLGRLRGTSDLLLLFRCSVLTDSLQLHDCRTPGFNVLCLPELAQTHIQ